MKKIQLNDLTFLIPVRIDSMDRLENLIGVINFLYSNFETSIDIQESTVFDNGILKKILPKTVNITFSVDYDPVFHRTRILNEMIERVTTPFVAIWDADVLVSQEQLINSVNLLRNNKADLVSPYSGDFLDTSNILRFQFLKHCDIGILERHIGKMRKMYGPIALGGGFLVDLEVYKEIGMENEKYYGWGHEDAERIYRCICLNKRFLRVFGVMYHLSHSRGLNSSYQSGFQKKLKLNELRKCKISTKEELEIEISSWKEKRS